jgi:hypothetical protein
VLAAMHEITQKVEQQEGCRKARPSGGDGPGGQSDPQRSLELRPEGVRRRKYEGGKNQIKDPDPEIAEPSPQRCELSPPSRPAEFPQRHGQQAADDHDKDQVHLPCGPLLNAEARSHSKHPLHGREHTLEEKLGSGAERNISPLVATE